jgi:hypothetical protein
MGKAVNVATNIATAGTVGFGDNGFKTGVITGAVDKATGGNIDKAAGKIQGGLVNTLLGKKDPGTSDEVIDLADPTGRKFQSQAIGQYGDFLNQDTSQMAANQIQAQNNQIRQNAEDGTRQAQQLVAQRGLGNSSVGLNAILNQQSGVADKIGASNASQIGLENQMKQQNLNFATSGINQILNEQGQSKLFKQGQASKGRQGGLMPLIGGAAGAYFGGPAGAQVGMGLGQAATQIG